MPARYWRCVIIATGVLLVSLALALFVEGQRPAVTAGAAPVASQAGGDAYVYLFDSSTLSFVFTFTIPIQGAGAWDVTVVPGSGHQEVWFTAPGADRIGRLVYTDTDTFAFQEYTLTVGSRPLNLVEGGGFIWFTESGRNRIGRLDPASGHVDEFEIPTPNSYPADLDVSLDGSIWFSQMLADQIAHLVVTSTVDYSVTEYAGPTMGGGRPYGIVDDENSIYVAQTLNNRVTRFTPSAPRTQWVDIHLWPAIPVPEGPYKLARDSFGEVWCTERIGDRVTKMVYITFPSPTGYSLTPAGGLPSGLAVDENDRFWFTQSAAGQIGRLVLGAEVQRDYYPLPLPDMIPTGIASDNSGGIWVLAQVPHHLYLPAIFRD